MPRERSSTSVKHRLPKPLHVGGKLYRFHYDPELAERDLLGETSMDRGQIGIVSNSATLPTVLLETVVHETIHAIGHEWQLGDLLNDNSPEAERIVRSLTTGLLQVLPQLEDWLRETRRATEA